MVNMDLPLCLCGGFLQWRYPNHPILSDRFFYKRINHPIYVHDVFGGSEFLINHAILLSKHILKIIDIFGMNINHLSIISINQHVTIEY